MPILGFFRKHGKIEQYEKKGEPMGDIIPFPHQQEKKKGLEDLKLINISHPVKRAHGRQTIKRPYRIIQLNSKR